MLGIVFLLLLAVPVVELWVIVQVAGELGFLPTIALMVLVSAAGAWLLKQQGTTTWRRLNAALARGEMPGTEVVDGALILFGGALLLTPGFLTDAVGLLFLLPPTRAGLKRAARGWLRRLSRRRLGLFGQFGERVYDGRVSRVRRREASPSSDPERGGPRAVADRSSPPGHPPARGGPHERG